MSDFSQFMGGGLPKLAIVEYAGDHSTLPPGYVSLAKQHLDDAAFAGLTPPAPTLYANKTTYTYDNANYIPSHVSNCFDPTTGLCYHLSSYQYDSNIYCILHKSTDGGTTWTHTKATANIGSYYSTEKGCLEYNPTSGVLVYKPTHNVPWYIVSTNQGASWTAYGAATISGRTKCTIAAAIPTRTANWFAIYTYRDTSVSPYRVYVATAYSSDNCATWTHKRDFTTLRTSSSLNNSYIPARRHSFNVTTDQNYLGTLYITGSSAYALYDFFISDLGSNKSVIFFRTAYQFSATAPTNLPGGYDWHQSASVSVGGVSGNSPLVVYTSYRDQALMKRDNFNWRDILARNLGAVSWYCGLIQSDNVLYMPAVSGDGIRFDSYCRVSINGSSTMIPNGGDMLVYPTYADTGWKYHIPLIGNMPGKWYPTTRLTATPIVRKTATTTLTFGTLAANTSKGLVIPNKVNYIMKKV